MCPGVESSCLGEMTSVARYVMMGDSERRIKKDTDADGCRTSAARHKVPGFTDGSGSYYASYLRVNSLIGFTTMLCRHRDVNRWLTTGRSGTC